MYEIKQVILDGTPTWKFKCPSCGIWGYIDNDQYHGKVSLDCPNCEFHETINLKEHGTAD